MRAVEAEERVQLCLCAVVAFSGGLSINILRFEENCRFKMLCRTSERKIGMAACVEVQAKASNRKPCS